MEIKGILFDKDGTLIDFFEVWGRAIRPVTEELLNIYKIQKTEDLTTKILSEIGVHDSKIDPEGSLAWKPYDMIAQDISNIIHQVKPEVQIDALELKQHLSRLFFEFQTEKQKKVPELTNLKLLMETLDDMGIKIGIATTDEYDSVKVCMKKTGVEKQISFYGAAGMELPVKPDKELLLEAAKKWNLQPDTIAVVGDTPNDMRFAKNAGAIGIGVLSGTGTRADLNEIADYVIESVDELIPLVKKLHGKEI